MTVGGEVGGDTIDVDLVAAAVLACPSVARLSGGLMGEVATYLPGRRVRGVVQRCIEGRMGIEVHVVGRFGPPTQEISGQVQAAVRSVAPSVAISVFIDDLETEHEPFDAPVLRSPVAGPSSAPGEDIGRADA